jgi:hypothetical protein
MISPRFLTPLIALATVFPTACNGNGDSPRIPPRAAPSIEMLPAKERAAAQALVELESKARDRDGEALCQDVYLFPGGPSPECPGNMEEVFPTPDGYSIAIRSIRFDSPGHAFAAAVTRTVTESGTVELFPNTTFELRRRAGVWRVVFQT